MFSFFLSRIVLDKKEGTRSTISLPEGSYWEVLNHLTYNNLRNFEHRSLPIKRYLNIHFYSTVVAKKRKTTLLVIFWPPLYVPIATVTNKKDLLYFSTMYYVLHFFFSICSKLHRWLPVAAQARYINGTFCVKMQKPDNRKEIDWSLLWYTGLENVVLVPIFNGNS